MDLNKHVSFFDPGVKLKNKKIHIIGLGAIGSNVALQLAKLGVEDLHIWDFDKVDEHNVTNQLFYSDDVDKTKLDAVEEHLHRINKEIKFTKYEKGWKEGDKLEGIVFMCVDSVELRKKILEDNEYNVNIELIVDGRIALSEGQVYSAVWALQDQKDLLNEMCNFKDDEVDEDLSACGTTLSVMSTVQVTVSYMVSLFINYINEQPIPTQIIFDAFKYKTFETGKIEPKKEEPVTEVVAEAPRLEMASPTRPRRISDPITINRTYMAELSARYLAEQTGTSIN